MGRANGNHKDANWRFPKGQIEGRCGEVARIRFNNITATSENGCFIGGDTPDKVHHVYMDNVILTMRKQTAYEGGVYDKRPCRGEGFVKGDVHGVYVDTASDILINGLLVDWGRGFPKRGLAHAEKNASRVIVRNELQNQ